MNQTVELVKLWGEYEAKHPGGTLEGFFRYQLSLSAKKKEEDVPGWQMNPPRLSGNLMMLLRRISKFHLVYANKALEGTGLDQMDEFGILRTVYNQVNPIKSEAIYDNIIELSSGTNMLIRLKKRGLIDEYEDERDKRVRRLRLTGKGEEALKKARAQVHLVADMMLQGLPDEDKQLCLKLLQSIDDRFAELFPKQKDRPFEKVFRENLER